MLNLHPLCIITVVSTLVQFSPGLSFPCRSSDVNDFALTSIISPLPLLLYHTFNFLSRRWLHLVLIKSWVVCYSYLTEKKTLKETQEENMFSTLSRHGILWKPVGKIEFTSRRNGGLWFFFYSSVPIFSLNR